MSVTTVFREIVPPIVVFDTITAVTTFDASAGRGPFRQRTELQRRIDFHSRSRPMLAPPGGTPPRDRR